MPAHRLSGPAPSWRFLHGWEEPERLIQDGPTLGTVFTNDAISWKIRHVFGGGFLDYRGGYGAIVP